jgi:hypothetical protein
MLWETRGFECAPKCDSDEIIDRWHYDWNAYGNPDKIVEVWKEQGYTHVLLNRAGLDFLLANDPNAPKPESLNGLNLALAPLPLIKSTGGYEIYSLP